MNFRNLAPRSMVHVTLLVTAGLVGGCATPPSAGGGAGESAEVGFPRASYEAVELQWRQAAVATAFLSRLEELEAADPHPQDTDHHRGYEAAARHMLARATDRLNSYGVAIFDGATPEADAVDRADVRRVESEYAAQAISLQREVVRMERRAAVSAGGDSEENGQAVLDMAVLLSLRSAMVAVPLNTGSGASAGGGGAGAGVPKVAGVAGGVNPYTPGSPSDDTAKDDANKRTGFTSHPGYVPTPK